MTPANNRPLIERAAPEHGSRCRHCGVWLRPDTHCVECNGPINASPLPTPVSNIRRVKLLELLAEGPQTVARIATAAELGRDATYRGLLQLAHDDMVRAFQRGDAWLWRLTSYGVMWLAVKRASGVKAANEGRCGQ